jgi:SAM-dependent MidA family methyltransferase
MSYDPEARRDTPLARELIERIRREGPIPVADYMRACIARYYERQAVLGRRGDFVTAPEISQIFGELIGLWCAVVWQQMGSPATVHLIELGPGRGTLLRDALRATRIVPGFPGAVQLHCVEAHAAMAEAQRQTLAAIGVSASWHSSLAQIERLEAPVILIANELLDALPVQQAQMTAQGWRLRCVGMDQSGRLTLAVDPERSPPWLEASMPAARIGDIFEVRQTDLAQQLRSPASTYPAAALLIDYGHSQTGIGDTLQAVRNHAFEHPLTSPGEADVSALVDFQRLGQDASAAGFAVDGPVTQAELLGRLGILERARALIAANPARRGEIETGVARLISPDAMGTRFKAIGMRRPGLAPLPGF